MDFGFLHLLTRFTLLCLHLRRVVFPLHLTTHHSPIFHFALFSHPRIESSFCSYHEPTFKFFNPKLFTNQPPTFSPTLFPSRRKVLFLFFNNVFLLCPDLFQVIFIHVESNNEDAGKPVADYFGITGNDPKVIISRLFFILFLWLSHGILLLLFCSRLFCIHKK